MKHGQHIGLHRTDKTLKTYNTSNRPNRQSSTCAAANNLYVFTSVTVCHNANIKLSNPMRMWSW